MLIFEITVEILLGVLFIVLGILLFFKHEVRLINTFNGYVDERNLIKYTRIMGIAFFIMALGSFLMPLINYLVQFMIGYYIGIILYFIGIGLIVVSSVKYVESGKKK